MKEENSRVNVGCVVLHISDNGAFDKAGQFPVVLIPIPNNSKRGMQTSHFSNFHEGLYCLEISKVASR